MTDEQVNEIYKAGANVSHASGLRAVFNAGWYLGAGQTPNANSADKSKLVTKPTVFVFPKN